MCMVLVFQFLHQIMWIMTCFLLVDIIRKSKQNPSFLYVLTPDRTKLHDILEYSDYEKYNGMTHPWDKRGGDIGCFNAFQLLFK